MINLFYLLLFPYVLILAELEVGRWVLLFSFGLIIFLQRKYKEPTLNVVVSLIIYQAYALYSRLFLLPSDVVRGTMEAGVAAGMALMLAIAVTPFLILFPLNVIYKKNKKYIFLLLISLGILLFWLFLIYLDSKSPLPVTFY